jgi:hypothetical protein
LPREGLRTALAGLSHCFSTDPFRFVPRPFLESCSAPDEAIRPQSSYRLSTTYCSVPPLTDGSVSRERKPCHPNCVFLTNRNAVLLASASVRESEHCNLVCQGQGLRGTGLDTGTTSGAVILDNGHPFVHHFGLSPICFVAMNPRLTGSWISILTIQDRSAMVLVTLARTALPVICRERLRLITYRALCPYRFW